MEVAGEVVGAVAGGLVALVGVGPADDESDAAWLAKKLAYLRLFADDDDKMNRSLLDVGGGLLLISQFTLYGDCRHGHRPSFTGACEPVRAKALFERVVDEARTHGLARVETGVFGASMRVSLCNDGPVTLLLQSPHD